MVWLQSAQPRELKCQELEEKKPAGAGGGKSAAFWAHTRGHTHSQLLHLPTAVVSWSRSAAPGVSLPESECLFGHFLVVPSGLTSIEPQFPQLENGLHNTCLIAVAQILGFLCDCSWPADSIEEALPKQTHLSFSSPLQEKLHREGLKQGQELPQPHILPHLLAWVLASGGQSTSPCALEAAVVPDSSS